MPELDVWKLFASLGVPGLALGVYYMLFRQFKWEFPKVPRIWVGPIIVLFMVLTAAIVYTALTRSSASGIDTNLKQDPIDRELASSAVSAVHELDFDSRYLYEFKLFLLGKSDRVPVGRLRNTDTFSFLAHYFDKVAPFTYGEEDELIPLVKEMDKVAEPLGNIRDRKSLQQFEQENKYTIDDLRFLIGFLRWYISGIAEKNIPEEFSSSFLQSGGSLYVDYEPLFMKYFVKENGTPITSYSHYLGLID